MGKVFELIIEDENDLITAISLVEKPAIEEDFMYFSKAEVQFAQLNNEKRMLVGPILIPDKQILRVDEVDGVPYHVFFSKPTVAKLAQNYLKSKLIDSATLEHDKKIKGVHLVESWIKEGKLDKSNSYGMNMPEGTWMGKFYIDESKEGNTIWNDYVKTGRVKGFSVEALMEHRLVKASAHADLLDKQIIELSDIEANIVLKKIREMFENPSVSSSYPGEVASGSIAPALLAEIGCPEATQKIGVNLFNRQNAIRQAKYGPLNPNEPNEDYWKAKADQFGSSVEEAKKALCGNCVFFYRTPQILECIASGIDAKGVDDPFAAIDAGELGYCEAFDFKCAASRTCDAWVVGGPITK
jgi:hypothetical protein